MLTSAGKLTMPHPPVGLMKHTAQGHLPFQDIPDAASRWRAGPKNLQDCSQHCLPAFSSAPPFPEGKSEGPPGPGERDPFSPWLSLPVCGVRPIQLSFPAAAMLIACTSLSNLQRLPFKEELWGYCSCCGDRFPLCSEETMPRWQQFQRGIISHPPWGGGTFLHPPASQTLPITSQS